MLAAFRSDSMERASLWEYIGRRFERGSGRVVQLLAITARVCERATLKPRNFLDRDAGRKLAHSYRTFAIVNVMPAVCFVRIAGVSRAKAVWEL